MARYAFGGYLPSNLSSDDSSIRAFQLIGAPGTFGSGGLTIILSYTQAHSRGKVVIQSSDPLAPSLADNNYMTDPLDVAAFQQVMLNYLKPWFDTLHAINPAYAITNPPAATLNDPNLLKTWILSSFTNNFHWTSTVKMSTSQLTGVVDPTGKVFGSDNLFVGDVTILPTVTDGNPCQAAYLTGQLVAKGILSGGSTSH